MGQAASDPIGSARQLKDQDLLVLWKSHLGPDGKVAPQVSSKRDSDGRSALHIAASEGKRGAVEFLLSRSDISVNCPDNNMITPLHSAVFRNHHEVASDLIKAGADLNAQDTQGLTPLHWSVINGALDCISVLLEAGADEDVKNLKDQTALDIAKTLRPRLRAAVLSKLERDEHESKPIGSHNVVPKETLEHMNEFARQQLFASLLDGVGKDVRRMLALCKIWGIIKYTHPYLAYRLIKWDEDLMEAAEICSDPNITNKQYLSAIMKLVGKLSDPNTRVLYGNQLLTPELLEADVSPLPSKPASSTAPTTSSLHLPLGTSQLPTSSPAKSSEHSPQYPRVTLSEDKLAYVDFSNFEAFPTITLQHLVQTFASLDASSQGIVFDVRCTSATPSAGSLGLFFQEAFRALIHDPVVLPFMRQRVYQGLPEHVKLSPTGPNLFEHGFLVSDANLLQPMSPPASMPPRRRPISFIIDKHTPIEIINVAIGLQSRAQAYIVMQCEKSDCLILGEHVRLVWEPGIVTTDFKLSEIVEGPNKSTYGDIVVQVRQNERFNPDGTVGLRPDHLIVVSNGTLSQRVTNVLEAHPSLQSTVTNKEGKLCIQSKFKLNTTHDAALEVALLYCYGKAPRVEGIRQLPFPIRQIELEYRDVELPSRNARFLALCRLWNAVRFFYPYKHLLPFPWEFAFVKTMSAFSNADSPAKYSLAIADVVTMLSDAHAYVRSPHLGHLVGTHVPSIRVKQIGDSTIVTHVTALIGDGTHSKAYSPRLPPLVAVGAPASSSPPEQSGNADSASSSASSPSSSTQTPSTSKSTTKTTNESGNSNTNASDTSTSSASATATSASANRDSSRHIVVKHAQKEPHHAVEQLGVPNSTNGEPPVLQLGIQVGDSLVAVDGTPVQTRREYLATLFSLSTPQAKKWRTDMKLLAGPEGSLAKLTLKRPVSRVLEVQTAQSQQPQPPQYVEYTLEVPRVVASQMTTSKSGPVVSVLEMLDTHHRHIAYMDLTRLTIGEVDAALDQVLAPTVGSIILDLRGHTRGTIFRIAPHFATHVTHVATTEVPLLVPTLLVGDMQGSMQLRGQQVCVPSTPVSQRNTSSQAALIGSIKLVALINEETMSHGEYAAMVLKAVRPDVVFVGTPSTGSLGSVTNIPLPGGILIGFTAMGILRADGAYIQQKGIVPDFPVLERAESILTGRDDIMETAISFLKTS